MKYSNKHIGKTEREEYLGFQIEHSERLDKKGRLFIISEVLIFDQVVLNIVNGSLYWAQLKCNRFIDLNFVELEYLKRDIECFLNEKLKTFEDGLTEDKKNLEPYQYDPSSIQAQYE